MAKQRILDTATLNAAARDWAGQWLRPTIWSKGDATRAIMGRDWVLQSFYNADFRDEFDHLLARFRAQLGADALAEFDAAAGERFTPRDDAVFEQLLAEKLAINPAGEHIPGAVGSTEIGTVAAGTQAVEVETPHSLRRRRLLGLGKEHRQTHWVLRPRFARVFAGQQHLFGAGAQNMNIAAATAILGLDALLDDLDSGTGAAVIQGRSGAQPVDPDAATTGTLLFTLVMTDPAFAGATDQANGTVRASASAITDDSAADATGTLGYCRVSSTNDGATPLDEKIDGEAATSGADFNFNTVSIVAGATVSMTSYTVTLDQGTTAT
jgi:hypothetical protein